MIMVTFAVCVVGYCYILRLTKAIRATAVRTCQVDGQSKWSAEALRTLYRRIQDVRLERGKCTNEDLHQRVGGILQAAECHKGRK